MVDDPRARWPGAVPDDDPGGEVDVDPGVDTDGDGLPDTLLTDDGTDLLVHVDLDADGLADRLLRIGPDGSVRAGPEPGAQALDIFSGDPPTTGGGWPGPEP